MKTKDAVAVIAALGMIVWMITDFYGGMIIYLLSYWFIIIPALTLYIVSFIITLVLLIRRRWKSYRPSIISHVAVMAAILIFIAYNSELFRSKRVLTAILKDDQFHYTLVFRKNGKVENHIFGIFGFSQEIKGHYLMQGDTIIFTKKPYDNNFIPDTALIDRSQNAIFLTKDKEGFFITQKEWLNHFEIIAND